MDTSNFDFDLPVGLIAQRAAEPRDRSRLMVVHRASGTWEHRVFADLPDLHFQKCLRKLHLHCQQSAVLNAAARMPRGRKL